MNANFPTFLFVATMIGSPTLAQDSLLERAKEAALRTATEKLVEARDENLQKLQEFPELVRWVEAIVESLREYNRLDETDPESFGYFFDNLDSVFVGENRNLVPGTPIGNQVRDLLLADYRTLLGKIDWPRAAYFYDECSDCFPRQRSTLQVSAGNRRIETRIALDIKDKGYRPIIRIEMGRTHQLKPLSKTESLEAIFSHDPEEFIEGYFLAVHIERWNYHDKKYVVLATTRGWFHKLEKTDIRYPYGYPSILDENVKPIQAMQLEVFNGDQGINFFSQLSSSDDCQEVEKNFWKLKEAQAEFRSVTDQIRSLEQVDE